MINLNLSLSEVEQMSNGINKAIQLAIYALMTDGSHHKQWYI